MGRCDPRSAPQSDPTKQTPVRALPQKRKGTFEIAGGHDPPSSDLHDNVSGASIESVGFRTFKGSVDLF